MKFPSISLSLSFSAESSKEQKESWTCMQFFCRECNENLVENNEANVSMYAAMMKFFQVKKASFFG